MATIIEATPVTAAEPPAQDARPEREVRPRRRSRMGEYLLVGALLVVSGTVHAWNMFAYPYFENDEATYLSRGWAFVEDGQLDVNTYRYDHAPFGWMVIGAWLRAVDGGEIFGGMLEAGRVLMLVVHLANTLLVYVIAKRLSRGSIVAGVIAVLIFALSPLGIYFQRRVLLDNLMALFTLIAMVLLLRRPLTLGATVGSGLIFGLAVLTKLNAAFFGLGFLALLIARTSGAQRKHALLQWCAAAAGTVAMFFVYALLKNELFPAPVDANGVPDHVSLVDTFALQLGRGDMAWPWDPSSSIAMATGSWLLKDSFTLIAGAVAVAGLTVILLVHRFRDSDAIAVLATIAGYVLFLARGGIVIDLYIAPLIPFLAIAAGMLAARLVAALSSRTLRAVAAVCLTGAIATAYVATGPHVHLYKDETSNQEDATAWILQNVASDAVIAGDNFAYPALSQEGPFRDAFYFFSAEYDLELRERYGDDWRNIDYVLLTHEVVEQISQGTVPRIAQVLEHAELAASYTEGSTSFIDIDQRISTNGDWAQVWKIKSRNQIVLQDAWTQFQDDWIVSYGQVLEEGSGLTTSLDQALAMEQALAQGDEAAFRGVWQWTTDHLRHRENDSMVSWAWETDEDGEGELGSSDTVCAADQRIIGILLDAAEHWADPSLINEATEMADGWWERCTFTQAGRTLVDSSADGSIDDRLVNPSYFNPVLYRRLATALPEYDWETLIDDGYGLLAELVEETGTVPNWAVVTSEGELASAVDLTGAEADSFGEDALRLVPTLIREELAGEARASALLDVIAPLTLAYADGTEGVPSDVTLAMVAQVRDVGVDPEDLYEDIIAARVDPATGAWDSTLTEFSWLYAWHTLYEDLPPYLRVPIA